MEKLAYLLKRRAPWLFRFVERVARAAVNVRYGPRLADTLEKAELSGFFAGHRAVVRPLVEGDLGALQSFLNGLPAEHLHHFHPHPFDTAGLQLVLRSRAFLTYGIVTRGRLIAYCLLKIAPTGSAFIGLLVHPDYGGRGLGKFIVAYLYWQASMANLRTRSTISLHNTGSLRSHRAIADYSVVAQLPEDYIMIEFPSVVIDKPEFDIQ